MKKGKLEPEYWGDPSGNIRRISGEQEIIATITPDCTEEWKALCSIGAPRENAQEAENQSRKG